MLRRRTVLSGVLLPLVPACQPAPGTPSEEAEPDAAGEDAAARADGARASDVSGADAKPADARSPDAGATEDAASAPDRTAEPEAPDSGAAEANDDAAAAPAITRIGFGSCNRLEMNQGFWPRIIERKPEVFLFLGDAIYVDHANTYA